MKKQLFLIWILSAAFILVAFLSLPRTAAAPNEARTIRNTVLNSAPQNVVVTGAQTITPSLSLMTFNNPTVLTLTLAANGAIKGDYLTLIGEVVTNTLVQTANTSLTSAQTISQNDVLDFIFANGQWILANSQDNAAD